MAVRVRVCGLLALTFAVLGACSGKSGSSPDAMEAPTTGGKKPSDTGSTSSPGNATGGSRPIPTEPSTGGEVAIAGAAPSAEAGAGPEVGGAGNDVAIIVNTSVTAVVHESYGTLQLQIVLTVRPSAAVEVGLSSSDPTHATVSPTSLTFTPKNWATPQVAVIAGEADLVADGAHEVTIETLPAVSNDARYAELDAADFELSVLDDTEPGISAGLQTSLVTTESGGTVTVHIVLHSMPTASVTIPLTSSDPSEGTVATSVTFEPSEWNLPHPVTVTGVDDNLQDGNQVYEIVLGAAVTTDPVYALLQPHPVQLTNVDNE